MTPYKFSLSSEQVRRLDEWISAQNQKAVNAQKANPPRGVPLDLLESYWEDGFPYSGATGGCFTYSFTPTSIGVVVSVYNSHTGGTIDLTNYATW